MRGIYARTDPHGKTYVGLSTDIERRWKEENYAALHPKQSYSEGLSWALKQYGVKNFKNTVLEEVPFDQSLDIFENAKILSEREKFWIDKLDTYNNGYNLTKGGSGVIRSAAEKEVYYKEHEEEIIQAIKDGIPGYMFVSRFHLDDSYYECLKEVYPVKANLIEYKAKNGLLNRGERIWYNKKKNRAKKSAAVKDWQQNYVCWVDFSHAEFNLSYRSGGHNRKTTFKDMSYGHGLLIENKVYYDDDGHFYYANSKSLHITKQHCFNNVPDWATDFLITKGKMFVETLSG